MDNIIRIGFAVMLALLLAVAVRGGETADSSTVATTAQQTDQSSAMEVPSLSEMVLPSLARIAISLVVIVIVIYGFVFLMKKLSGNRIGSGNRGTTVQIIEQTYLAPKKSVCLIKLADRAVLVGVTEHNVNMLTEFNWDELPEDITARMNSKKVGFQALLNGAAGKLFGNKGGKGANHESL